MSFGCLTYPLSLEGLPTKLKSAILHSSADFDPLKALVHASPSFYHAYTGMCRSALSTFVLRELHSDVILDALAVHGFSQLQGQRPGHVNSFLKKVQVGQTHENPNSTTGTCLA